MKYREFGELGWNVSALGFGAMRLPIKGADAAKIKERRVMSNCSGFVAGGKGFEPLSQAPEACALSKLAFTSFSESTATTPRMWKAFF